MKNIFILTFLMCSIAQATPNRAGTITQHRERGDQNLMEIKGDLAYSIYNRLNSEPVTIIGNGIVEFILLKESKTITCEMNETRNEAICFFNLNDVTGEISKSNLY